MARSYFTSDQHALAAGVLIGSLIRAGHRAAPHTDENGSYLPTMDFTFGTKTYLVTITEKES